MENVAAPPGTYIVERSERTPTTPPTTIKIPVVAFAHVQGGRAFPVCAINTGGLTLGRALLTADGFVTDPAIGAVFPFLEAWEELVDTEGYRNSTPKVGFVPPTQETGEDDDTMEMHSPSAGEPGYREPIQMDGTTSREQASRLARHNTVEVRPARIPDKPKPAKKARQFKDRTFWQSSEHKWIWIVLGGTDAIEIGDYAKIKRDDFDALKREGWTVMDYDDVANGVIPGEAEASSDEEDENEAMDLV